MLPISPIEYLLSFALAYLCGVLWSICFCKYVGKVRREATCHA